MCVCADLDAVQPSLHILVGGLSQGREAARGLLHHLPYLGVHGGREGGRFDDDVDVDVVDVEDDNDANDANDTNDENEDVCHE